MIKRFRVQNYKALRDVTLDLTPIHVLIGPNDSGKTSMLEATAALCRSVDHPLAEAFMGLWEARSLVWHGKPDLHVSFEAIIADNGLDFEYILSCAFGPTGRQTRIAVEQLYEPVESPGITLGSTGTKHSTVFGLAARGSAGSVAEKKAAQILYDALLGVHYYRWNPRMLALPVAPDAKRRFRMEPSGFGLALCLDDILGFDRVLFDRIENRFKKVFPDVQSIKLLPEPAFRATVDDPVGIEMLNRADGKGLHFQFIGGDQLVSASQVSDGMLLVLAYLAVLHLPRPPRVLLVEEPENGIHPKRLQDVLKILRDLVEEQSHTQVILTTHSPYVLDMFKPEEVSVCIREDDGSVTVHKLSDSKTVREQLDVFTLGEIWTAEGDEAIARSATSDEEPSE